MPCDLTTIQNEACSSGIGRVRDKITLLQLIAQLTCEASENAGGGAVWGDITGTLSNQSDLQATLDERLVAANNLSDVADVVTARNNLGMRRWSTTTSVVASGTGDNNIISFTLPGGSLGPNGYLRWMVMLTATNNANAKFLTVYFGSTLMYVANFTTQTTLMFDGMLANRNNQAAQIIQPNTIGGFPGVSGLAPNTAAVNTASDQTVTLRITKAVDSDTLTSHLCVVEATYMP